jgi:hypothetical protein
MKIAHRGIGPGYPLLLIADIGMITGAIWLSPRQWYALRPPQITK